MSKVKIAVVENEVIIADHICDTLLELGYEVFESAASFTEGLTLIEKQQPDLVLLDIQLSGKKDGIDLAEKLREQYDIPFIFLTSNADKLTLDRAKNTHPGAYLVKPFNKEELFTSIEIALHNFGEKLLNRESSNNTLFIKRKQHFVKVEKDDILYIKSDHIYLEVYTKQQEKFLVRSTIADYQNLLGSSFIRIHRSYIINSNNITSFSNTNAFINEIELPIGKSYKNLLFEKIMQ